VGALQILVQTITFADEFLLPLSESVFFDLDLLGEALPQALFLFLELGVVEFSGTGLAEFTGFHLLSAVGFVVGFFGGVNEVQHVGSDEDGAEFLEVAVVFVLNFCYSPGVLTTLDDTSVGCLDVLLRSNNGEWHSGHQTSCMLCCGLIVLLDWWGIYFNALCLDDCSNLHQQ
jgi:hypothetical protein